MRARTWENPYIDGRLSASLEEDDAAVLEYSNAKPMNMVGSTTVTPAKDTAVKAHGNHTGKGVVARIQDASQNGHMPAM